MGAVRIYKDSKTDVNFPWQIRSDGCKMAHSGQCEFGETHEGYCNGYTSFEEALDDWNDPCWTLRNYLNK